LDLDVLVDAILRAFTAQAGFLHATKGRDFRRDDTRVDAYDAIFERFGYAPNARNIAAIEIRGQAKFRVIGKRNGLRLRSEAEKRRDRAKRLFAGHCHGWCDVGENGRLKEPAAERVTMPTYQNLCAFLLCVANVAFHFFNGGIVDERPLRRT